MAPTKQANLFLFLFFILLLVGFFSFARASGSSLIITELMYNPDGTDTKHEWIEIRNSGSATVDLTGWKFFEAGVNHGLTLFQGSFALQPDEYAIVADDAVTFATDYPDYDDIIIDSVFSLNNSGETIAFKNTLGEIVTELSYANTPGADGNGFSLEKDDAEFRESYVQGGTPGAKNSEKPIPPPPIIYSDKIRINELLPDPAESPEDKYEYIELYNPGAESVDLSGWLLQDKTGEYKLSGSLKAESYATFYDTVSLNNSGDEITLSNPTGKIVSQVSYGDSTEGTSYNFDGAAWRWSKFLTPDAENIFNNLPDISSKKDHVIYVNTYTSFSSSGKDKDNDKLKYTWNFGDGHKSYLQKTRHKYEKTGKYTATLKVSDGSEDVTTTYDIEVIEYPKLKIRIVALSPNPDGVDTGNEFIALKNETKKKVNLKGWSIATGWGKKMINHPISEKFEIKAGKTKNLTAKYASITLNNTQAKIELRNPAGKVIDKVKYENKKGVPENAVYEKVKKKWLWNEKSVPVITKPAETEPLAIPAPTPEVAPAITPEIEIQTNLGKTSTDPQWHKKQENKILLASANSNFNIPAPQGRVLGAATIRETGNFYAFTSPTAPEKHWAMKIGENIFTATNSFINTLLLQF